MASGTSKHSDPAPLPYHDFGARVSLWHVAIIALSLLVTLSPWKFTKDQIDVRSQARFEAAGDSVLARIHDGFQRYETVLWAGVSAIASHQGDMTPDQWHAFVDSLNIAEKYPGIRGIGLVRDVEDPRQTSYVPARPVEPLGSVVLPSDTFNLKAFMPLITPDGTARITGPVPSLGQTDRTADVLLYAPVIKGGAPADRPQPATAAVYAPIAVGHLMASLLANQRRDVHISIRDADRVLYDEHAADTPHADPDPMFQRTATLSLYGRIWDIDMRSTLTFRHNNTYAQPTVVLVGGLIIEALIISLLVMMSRANTNAIAYADKVTAALRDETRKLNATNDALEQFAYVASHDLKTPIRGIGGLTEMLREDLEDYLASPDANQEVAEHLDHIEERVARMSDLTRGIIDFSRAGSAEPCATPLNLAEAISSMSYDFGLTGGQLCLQGTVRLVEHDPVSLRRVLENLVGNAIKYHDGGQPLRIVVTASQNADRLHFTVVDNGPGIAPQFHARIFDVFQTLRSATCPESTGIGLAIVKKLVERHHGTIKLTSAPGDGATFAFDWPLRQCLHTSPPLMKTAA